MPYVESPVSDDGIRARAESDVISADGYGLINNSQYLTRCQVDTPPDIVSIVWQIAHKYRPHYETVLDAGAGDGRFSAEGNYTRYFGYEIDSARLPIPALPSKASIIRSCAFAEAEEEKFDLSIGNPPYVRHHDLSDEWRKNISKWIESKTGVKPSGLSNAYLYFVWLSLISTREDGVVALVIPYEWVVRPAAEKLRNFIARKGWSLDVYRFDVEPFPRVLTTASVTVVNKGAESSAVRYFGIDKNGGIRLQENATSTPQKPLDYLARNKVAFAQRGLSPGGQSVFVLTETQRLQNKLIVGKDVVPCITSLRYVDASEKVLDQACFEKYFVKSNKKCWLIVPSNTPSEELSRYLDEVDPVEYDNYTCNKRDVWWRFTMPSIPALIYSSGFRGDYPKVLRNRISAVCVGSVCGIHTASKSAASSIFEGIRASSLRDEVVAVSRGFTKIEVNQMNAVIGRILS